MAVLCCRPFGVGDQWILLQRLVRARAHLDHQNHLFHSFTLLCVWGRLPDVKMALNTNWVCLLSLLRKSSASEKSDGPAKAHWAPYCRKHWGMASAAAAPPPPYVTSLLLAMWSEQLEKQSWVMCILQVGYSQNLHYMLTLNSPLKLLPSDNWLHFRPGKIHMQSGNRLQN